MRASAAICFIGAGLSLPACVPWDRPTTAREQGSISVTNQVMYPAPGWEFVGDQLRPGANIEISMRGGPIPCARSYCASPDWRPLAVAHTGATNQGNYPAPGTFRLAISSIEAMGAAGGQIHCRPAQLWKVEFRARDRGTFVPTVIRTVYPSTLPTSAPLFGNQPPCS